MGLELSLSGILARAPFRRCVPVGACKRVAPELNYYSRLFK